MALKRSVFKPGAFFKGIILPLCRDYAGCTLKEAKIIGSVMTKVHLPMMHSAAAMMKLASIDTGFNPIW